MKNVGIVIIGRNEGERLRRSLAAAIRCGCPIVYVDSGSTDGSIELARVAGVHALALGADKPFSASRSRNEGFEYLSGTVADLVYVQFVDGDSELDESWIERAVQNLSADAKIGAVCGILRERYPEASIYNRISGLEWDRTVGELNSCGGIAMYRAEAFRAAGGFNPAISAGEEADLCARLKLGGWRILRINQPMAAHDSGMTRFGQWWKRAVRSGFAYALGARQYPEGFRADAIGMSRRIWFWGLLPIVLASALVLEMDWLLLAVLALYAASMLKNGLYRRTKLGDSVADSTLYAVVCVVDKWPQLFGQLVFKWDSIFKKSGRLIEPK